MQILGLKEGLSMENIGGVGLIRYYIAIILYIFSQ